MTFRMCANLVGVGVLMAFSSLSPRITEEIHRGTMFSTAIRFLHLYSFGTWIGMQFWVSFVAGYKMYFTLTRHTFGHLQSQLFPVYFKVGSCLSTVALVTYCLLHPLELWNGAEKYQVCGLVISVFATIINAAYMEPKVTALMMERYTYEKELGYGDSIGPIKDKALKQDEKYLEMTHRFCMVHGFTSMANILSYTGCIVHLWYLTKSQVLLM